MVYDLVLQIEECYLILIIEYFCLISSKRCECMNTLLKKKPTKAPPPKAKKKKPTARKEGQEKFSLKRLLMGEEKPDLTELESGSTTILDILSPTTVDTKSRDYIVVDGVCHAYLYVTGYGYATTVGSCWLAPLVEAGEGVNLLSLIHI